MKTSKEMEEKLSELVDGVVCVTKDGTIILDGEFTDTDLRMIADKLQEINFTAKVEKEQK